MTFPGLLRTHHRGGGSLNRMILLSGVLHLVALVLLMVLGPVSAPTRLTFGPVYSVSLVSMADTALNASPAADLTRDVLGAVRQDRSTVLRKEPDILPKRKNDPTPRQTDLDRTIEELRRKVAQTERAAPARPDMTARLSTPSGGMSDSDLNRRMGVYYAVLWNRIRSQWALPADLTRGQALEAVVHARILRSGEITGLEFEKRSGNRFFDESVLRAMQKAAPFPPLPEWIPDRMIDVGIRFHSSQLKR